ncbi:Lrp/AsnC family transcriptional regulator [Actinokineospora bangkokensis]|uniref:AsnC family transcriptional regulator n=1 Tax=Actinokineospora bangkokensis TaxID=1193682 RepID=A0A1Q9LMR6_9PSEU|nr:Lrp/AsnC family transcriptional regulator [Actinokineospora bangkokensis]OLR93337.1 AsnC family transcriptional regulator [Actinokineospora bangkokensis]
MPQPLYDRVDRAIMEHLQRHGRTPNVELAEAVHLSPTSCLRRTKALEADGVIAGYRADLDRERLGLGLTVFLSLKVEHSRTSAAEVGQALAAIEHVVACHVVSGDADFLVELAVPDLRTFEAVLYDRVLAIAPILDVRSTVVIRTIVDRGPLPLTSWAARPARQDDREAR